MKITNKIFLIITSIILLITSAYSFDVDVVNTNPAPITAGEYADITLRISNPSEDARNNIVITIDSSQDIYPLSSDKITLSKINGKEDITKTVRVFFSESIPEGFVNLPISIKSDKLLIKEDILVYIQDAQTNPQLYIGDVTTIPDELLPDTKDNLIMVSIQNLGDKDADLVSAQLIVDNNLIKPSNSYSLKDSVSSIKSGEEQILEFEIDIEEEVKEQVESKLLLRYRSQKSVGNSYDTYEEEIDFNIEVSQAPYLEVTNVDLQSSFEIGSSENIIRLTIKNTGSEHANEVRVRIVPDSSYPFSFEKFTEYVTSKIEVDEEVTVDFKVEVLSNAQIRDYPTTLLIESLVGETRYTQDDYMTITTTGKAPKTNNQLGGLIIGLVIVISIILGGYRIINSKRNKHK
jgi:hypothetical protein